jgi:hypothetical protein
MIGTVSVYGSALRAFQQHKPYVFRTFHSLRRNTYLTASAVSVNSFFALVWLNTTTIVAQLQQSSDCGVTWSHILNSGSRWFSRR